MPVSFIPSQLEAPRTAALPLKASPSKLLYDDVKHVSSIARYIPWIFLPLRSQNRYAESSPSRANIQDVGLHCTLFFLTISGLSYGVRMVFWATGVRLIMYTTGCWLGLMALCKPLNYGPRVMKSNIDLTGYPDRPKERWIFVNGIGAGSRWLQGMYFSRRPGWKKDTDCSREPQHDLEHLQAARYWRPQSLVWPHL